MNRIDALPHPTPAADVPEAPAAPDAAASDKLYLPLIRLWMLRALLRCNGARNFVGENRLRDPAVAEMLELKGLSRSRYSETAAMRALQRKLDELERLGPTFPGTPSLARNIQRLAQRLALNPVERDILHFACVQHVQSQLCDVLGMVGDLTRASVCQLFADCLGHPVRAVQYALDDRGRLCRSALLSVDDDRSYTFDRKIDLLPGLAESLLLEHDDLFDLFGQAVVKAPAPTLALADYQHLGDDLRILRSYLDTAGAKGQLGVNVLLHGRPGTGKTELARAVAAELGLVLMEVPTEEPSGKPRAGRERFESYRFAQCLLEGSRGHAVLFDEVEDVFASASSPWRNESRSGIKGWINQVLERNTVPALWITNSLAGMDPAYLRRFDLVLALDVPPLAVRRRLVDRHLGALSLPPAWCAQVAEHDSLAPAVLARAAKVISQIEDPGLTPQAVLTRVMNHTLQAMGESRLPVRAEALDLPYRLDLLNADCDLKRLIDGLRQVGEARLCLYGPPGTGKTAYGRHLAQSLGRPLLVKRASDILSPYVGVAERQLARMFQQAKSDGAVLLLDEADSLLRERTGAQRSWEVTLVNEMLTQMEAFSGVFVASTNLMDTLDAASLRRFDARIRLGYLRPMQAWSLFEALAGQIGIAVPTELRAAMAGMKVLTPGDFAAEAWRCRLDGPRDAGELLARLRAVCEAKPGVGRRAIGFTA